MCDLSGIPSVAVLQVVLLCHAAGCVTDMSAIMSFVAFAFF